MLRPIRVGLGPTSIIVALYISAIQMNQVGEASIINFIRLCLAALVFVSTFFAGVVFRPDNLEIFNQIQHSGINPVSIIPRSIQNFGKNQRKEGVELKAIHGILNLTSVLISLVIVSTFMFIGK